MLRSVKHCTLLLTDVSTHVYWKKYVTFICCCFTVCLMKKNNGISVLLVFAPVFFGHVSKMGVIL